MMEIPVEETREKLSESLIAVVENFNVFLSPEEIKKREEIINRLDHIWQTWMLKLIENGDLYYETVEREVLAQVKGKVVAFGSFIFGVSRKESDIDVVCVAPKCIRNDKFVNVFSAHLAAMPEVSDLMVLDNSQAPLIRIKFDGVSIDILFSRLAIVLPDDLTTLSEDDIIGNCSKRAVSSSAGWRDAGFIHENVPNVDIFRKVLRIIIIWSKKREVNGKQICFPNNIGWTLMVAYVCIQNPDDDLVQLVQKFFTTFAEWDWTVPIRIKEDYLPEDQPRKIIKKHFKIKPTSLAKATMKVVSPLFPQQNKAVKVTPNSMKKIMAELTRGVEVVSDVVAGRKQWQDLFEAPPDFFTTYNHFLALVMRSNTRNGILYGHGLVECQVSTLMSKLLLLEEVNAVAAYPKIIERESFEGMRYASIWFVGLDKWPQDDLLEEKMDEFMVHYHDFYRPTGMHGEFLLFEIKQVERDGLDVYLNPSE